MEFVLIAVAVIAGLLGALLGIGGGTIIVPIMVMLGFPIHEAVGTSLIAVVATSIGGALVYLKAGMTNLQLAMILEVTTTLGAICGSYLAFVVDEKFIAILFFLVAIFTVYSMIRREVVKRPVMLATSGDTGSAEEVDLQNGSMAFRTYHYWDELEQQWVTYTPRRIPIGLFAGYIAGILSGLLGIGGGPVKVPVLNLMMGVPTKVAVATSNYMVGITASASAFIYLNNGFVRPGVATLVTLGVLLGAQLGARISKRLSVPLLRWIFSVVILLLAGSLIFRA